MILQWLKYFGKALMYLLLVIIGLVFLQYILTPVYDFPESKPFAGDKLYNPYRGMDSSNWHKGNFQVQSHAWGGVTDGRKNSNEYIFEVYRKLDYDIIGISDYMKINDYARDQQSYLPVYEHGYGIKKNHQVIIGARKVVWRDYPVYQNLNHKQHIVDILRKHSDLVYIAHPRLRHGYAPEDMIYLTNYNGIEVLNGYRVSIEHWDQALSSGHYATILANDDAHDISNPDEVGHYCTFINAPTVRSEDVISALKQGRAFGADIEREIGETLEAKAKRAKTIPVLNRVMLIHDTLKIQVSRKAKEFRFIGQDGVNVHTVEDTATAAYVLRDSDHYIRAEISFPDRFTFYLNPVVRYKGETPFERRSAEVNIVKTSFKRLGILLLLFVGFIVIRWKRFKPKTKQS